MWNFSKDKDIRKNIQKNYQKETNDRNLKPN